MILNFKYIIVKHKYFESLNMYKKNKTKTKIKVQILKQILEKFKN